MSTTTTPASILADLQARGLVFQTTQGLAEHLTQPRTLYCGFDPTADSLHIGSLVPLLTLKRFQMAGHTPIILVGGATGLIGDPSFKAQERKLNEATTVQEWVEKLKKQTARFVSFEGKNAAKMANNYTWTEGVGILTFLREVGKHFSVNNLIGKEAIRSRLEREDSGISFTEFTYPLLQAFDFLQLFRTETCTVQIGGSDQWGNMTAGTELIRKAERGESHVLTLPLVTKADGSKFGKTESGTIWLDAAKTSPYAFYQFWLNTADADVEKFLHYYSFRPLEEIAETMRLHTQSPEKRIAQTNLADEITALLHGRDNAERALEISTKLFNNMVEALDAEDMAQLVDAIPTLHAPSTTLLEALTQTGLAASNREARDFLKGGAVQLNGQPVTDEKHELTAANAKYGQYHLLKRGKKNFALLVLA